MKIYAYNQIRVLISQCGHAVNDDNIADFQDAIDSDGDVNFTVKSGMWFHRDESSGRIFIHSNGSFGYAGRGTHVLAEIR